jgi:hypothetical protein
MSKRHQANRRRTYVRRQHELHERPERSVGVLSWIDEPVNDASGDCWAAERSTRATGDRWAVPVRIG